MNQIQTVPVDIFLDIIKDLRYGDIVSVGLSCKDLYSMFLKEKVQLIITCKRRKIVELKPRKSYQEFMYDDLKVGAIINRVLLNEFTQNFRYLLTKTVKRYTRCGCGVKTCDKHREIDKQWEEDLSLMEPYDKYGFIRTRKYDEHVSVIPYMITRVIRNGIDSELCVRRVEKIDGQYRYYNSTITEKDEILRKYWLSKSRIFGQSSTKRGFVFENGDIAIIPNSFKTR